MTPESHSLLSQLVQLGLESLAAKASAALNGIALDVPENATKAEAEPPSNPNAEPAK